MFFTTKSHLQIHCFFFLFFSYFFFPQRPAPPPPPTGQHKARTEKQDLDAKGKTTKRSTKRPRRRSDRRGAARTDGRPAGNSGDGRTDGRTNERRATVGTNSGQPGRTEMFLKAFRPKFWEVFGGIIYLFIYF
ncbi:unnamed protein product [Sphagnum jensenii]|uniref:Uncharacterized protein n=1 Tax=Sphagnum jensenii TaxID=128206 RepID=A0ABP0XBJ7_9BRYO